MTIRKNWLEKADAPIGAKARASDFSNWVYRASHGNLKSDPKYESYEQQRKDLGRWDEKVINQMIQGRAFHKFSKNPEAKRSPWKSYFIDDGYGRKIFKASKLTYKNEVVKCVPDVVLYNESENTYLIIERKTTRVPEEKIPEQSWPNIEAQLWCYGQIDEFEDAEEVFLSGEIWRGAGLKSGYQRHLNLPYWKRGNIAYHNKCLRWFKKFGGQFHI